MAASASRPRTQWAVDLWLFHGGPYAGLGISQVQSETACTPENLPKTLVYDDPHRIMTAPEVDA